MALDTAFPPLSLRTHDTRRTGRASSMQVPEGLRLMGAKKPRLSKVKAALLRQRADAALTDATRLADATKAALNEVASGYDNLVGRLKEAEAAASSSSSSSTAQGGGGAGSAAAAASVKVSVLRQAVALAAARLTEAKGLMGSAQAQLDAAMQQHDAAHRKPQATDTDSSASGSGSDAGVSDGEGAMPGGGEGCGSGAGCQALRDTASSKAAMISLLAALSSQAPDPGNDALQGSNNAAISEMLEAAGLMARGVHNTSAPRSGQAAGPHSGSSASEQCSTPALPPALPEPGPVRPAPAFNLMMDDALGGADSDSDDDEGEVRPGVGVPVRVCRQGELAE